MLCSYFENTYRSVKTKATKEGLCRIIRHAKRDGLRLCIAQYVATGKNFQNRELQHCTTPKSFEKWELQTCKTGF